MAELQRRLHRIDALAIALGSVIGVGVFWNTGLVLRGAGGLVGATVMWLVVGVVCLAGAILYADLSMRVPEAGGPYAYVRVAFGRPVAFVYGWMNAGVSMPVRQASTVAIAGKLLSSWLPGGERPLAVAVLVVLAGINLLGVRAGALTQRVFTAGKLGTIALVIGLAMVLAWTGSPTTTATTTSVSFGLAVAACWYTYLGWQDVVLLAEELREPRRDLPAVLLGTVALTMVLYLAVHFAVYYALGGSAEAYGELPARDIAGHVLGAFGLTLLTALTLASTLGGSAESMMVRPRVAMALARDGMAPAQIAAVNHAGTPHGAILFHSALSLALVATGSYTDLLPLLTFAQGFLGVFETASYFVVRRKRPELPAARFHPWAPLAFILANIGLCWLAAKDDLQKTLLALGMLALISAVYAIARPRVARGPEAPQAVVPELPQAVVTSRNRPDAKT
jgi:APA family basic amino acid/polyamine antiporter